MCCVIVLGFLYLVILPKVMSNQVCAPENPHVLTNLHNQPPKVTYAFVPLCA